LEVVNNIVTGRFQPFHLGHVAFINHVATLVDGPITIGIVNPDPKYPIPGDAKGWFKIEPEFNPLSFWERKKTIRFAQDGGELEANIDAIVPVSRPSINLQRAESFLPPKPRTFYFCQKWNDEAESWKIDRYRKIGEVADKVDQLELAPHTRMIEGQLIRALVSVSNESWRRLVPKRSLEFLDNCGFSETVKGSYSAERAERFLKSLFEASNRRELFIQSLNISTSSDMSELELENRLPERQRKLIFSLENPRSSRDGILTIMEKSENAKKIERLSTREFLNKNILDRAKITAIDSKHSQIEISAPTRDRIVELLRAEL